MLGCKCVQISMRRPTTSLATAAGSEAFFLGSAPTFWAVSPKRGLLRCTCGRSDLPVALSTLGPRDFPPVGPILLSNKIGGLSVNIPIIVPDALRD